MSASFRNDYDSLCHPKILEALSTHLDEHFGAYGTDRYSLEAGEKIKEIFGAKEGKVFFLAGGTQTNLTLISFLLRPYEAVISCDSGHINVHETGAVEGTGHKIILIPNHNGKLTAEAIEKTCKLYSDPHMVKPRMVYISNSTESGTIYSKQELLDIRHVCDAYGLYLFLDGARLGSALTCRENDLLPSDIGALADCFYVGGTKNGSLFGEALVIGDPSLAKDFEYHIKNRGALLAKGFVAGIMFKALFEDGLYFELARQANVTAELLREGLTKLGYDYEDSPTNQVFVKFSSKVAPIIQKRYQCELWKEEEAGITLRFVTSYLTKEEDIDELLSFLKDIR